MAEPSKIDHGAIVAAAHGLTRSPHWPLFEKHYLLLNPKCAASGLTTGVQVHHVFPFHFGILLGRPDTELDFRNYIGFSESERALEEVNYHLLLGHAGDFQSSNLSAREDALTFYGQPETQIKSSPVYEQRVAGRCKPWAEWTEQDKLDARAWLDKTYPLPVGVTPEQQIIILVAKIKTKGVM